MTFLMALEISLASVVTVHSNTANTCRRARINRTMDIKCETELQRTPGAAQTSSDDVTIANI